MSEQTQQHYTAFNGQQLLISGQLEAVVLRVKQKIKSDPASSILVFSDLTGKEMDFDLRGTDKDALQRLQVYLSTNQDANSTPGPGRPKLGVVAREVSLLPRHWEWLSTQSGGASATLRRLVEEAKKNSSSKELVKQAQERTHKFMSSMAGNLPNFEEALRALYAKDKKKFRDQITSWPNDLKEFIKRLSAEAFES